jgi:hypothetical protein
MIEPPRKGQECLIPKEKPTAIHSDELSRKSSRGDWTPLELFVGGVQGLPATVRDLLCQAGGRVRDGDVPFPGDGAAAGSIRFPERYGCRKHRLW